MDEVGIGWIAFDQVLMPSTVHELLGEYFGLSLQRPETWLRAP